MRKKPVCFLATAVIGLASLSHTNIYAQGSENTPSAPQPDAPVPAAIEAPQVAATTPPVALDRPAVMAISSPVPSYIDRGVTMVPLKPVAMFLGISVLSHDGVLTLSQRIGDEDSKLFRTATLRQGGRSAQLLEGGSTKSVALALPAETRLGNTFVPLKFIAANFGAESGFRVPDNAIVLKTPAKIGVLTPALPAEYSGKSAVTLTLTNRIGKPMSLRLNGPQKLALELGRGQSITRKLAPGVYYYQAACAGMKTRSGARRLSTGRRVTWSWGHR